MASSRSSSPLSFGSVASSRACDRMGEVELDAARALSEFAQLAVMERDARGSSLEGREWGSTARRSAIKRGGDRTRSPVSGRRVLLDLNQNASALEEQHHALEFEESEMEMKADSSCNPQVSKVASQSPSKSKISFGGGRSRQSVSEAEKEAKRLRRILANRESARQTIRRRQALREELIKKADTLSQDNEAMKKEKEHMSKEYLCLKDTNRQLKEKMYERVKLEVEEVPNEDDDVECKGHASITDKPTHTTQHLRSMQLTWPPHVSHENIDSGCALGSSSIQPYTWIHAITCSSSDKSESFPKQDCIDPSEAYVLEEAFDGSNRTENEASTSGSCGRMSGSFAGGHRLLTGFYISNPAARYPLSEVGRSICCSIGNTTEIPHDCKHLKKALGAAAAAAEARRRRKELTKPKHFCTR